MPSFDQAATNDVIARLLKPRSVAVIGASGDPAKTAGRPVHFLLKHGFTGRILPVNRRAESVAGLACYKDVRSLPEVPEVGLVLLGAEHAHRAVRDLAAKGTPVAIVLASGYGESGEEGRRRQDELVEAAGSMRLLGPNTIGLVNLVDKIPLSASGALDADAFSVGSISVVSQSGGILGALLSRAAARGVGLAKLVSTSNEMDLELADFVSFFAEDPDTNVIALYVETLRNPAKFRDAALKAAAAGKPMVAYKIGRSESGARAAISHTGALAGSDQIYDALFHQLGVIRAQRFGELLDITAALATGRRPRGKRVAVLTSTGGAGALVSDALGVAGFNTPAPDPETVVRLRALRTGEEAALDRNPIDVTLAGLRPEVLRGAAAALLGSESYDALVVIVGSSGVGSPALMAGAIQRCLAASSKPVLAYVSPHAPEAAALMTDLGIPSFIEPESCASALSAMIFADQRRIPVGPPMRGTVADLGDVPSGWLDEQQAKALFARAGVPGAREIVATTAQEAAAAAAALGGKVVLKVLSSHIVHKTEVGGVAVGQTPESIGARLARMTTEVARHTGAEPTGFLVQETVSGGIELILGMKHDPLGTAILLGMGGTTAEILRDTALRLLWPGVGLTADEGLALVRSLKSWPLLDGYRGRPKADVDALVAAIVAFSGMVAQLGDRLHEAEINPLFVLPAGAGVRAADGVVALNT